MIRFQNPILLYLLLLIPLWTAMIYFALRRRRKAAEQFAGSKLLEKIARSFSAPRLRMKALLWIVAYALVVMGLAGPQVGTRMEEVKREGIDIILAVDLSNSMLSQDLQPSRLENARQEIQKFVGGLKGDRVGLIAFAGNAIVHCPLTNDYGAVKMLVRVMTPDLVPEQGTALADAIEAARKGFNNPDVKSRVLVVITDGEDHEEQAIEAATEAAEEGIRIYTIGMGTPKGAPIPARDERGNDIGFKRDKAGTVVVSRLNDILLERIAGAGNGQYIRGTQSGRELEAIWTDIAEMEKSEFGKKQYTSFEDRFQYLVLPALLLLLGEFFLSERKGNGAFRRSLQRVGRTAREKLPV